jgi:7,8-dihydroneopterin aldolase/epimerase/oxygenase
MNDLLQIRDIELSLRIGVPDLERAKPQRILVDIGMPVDAKIAATSDSLDQTVDYAQVREDVLSLAKTEYKTIERLAEDAAELLLMRHPLLPSVDVEVRKFPFPDTSHVRLRIRRHRAGI